MEKYIEVINQSSELKVTVYDGLQHMQTLLNEGKFEDTIPLFSNIIQAFLAIENSLITLPEEVLTEDIQPLTIKVKDTLDLVVSSFELMNYAKIKELMQFTLMPGYKRWMTELDVMFNPYLVS